MATSFPAELLFDNELLSEEEFITCIRSIFVELRSFIEYDKLATQFGYLVVPQGSENNSQTFGHFPCESFPTTSFPSLSSHTPSQSMYPNFPAPFPRAESSTILPPCFCGSVCSLRLQQKTKAHFAAEYEEYIIRSHFNGKWHDYISVNVGISSFTYSSFFPTNATEEGWCAAIGTYISPTELRCYSLSPSDSLTYVLACDALIGYAMGRHFLLPEVVLEVCSRGIECFRLFCDGSCGFTQRTAGETAPNLMTALSFGAQKQKSHIVKDLAEVIAKVEPLYGVLSSARRMRLVSTALRMETFGLVAQQASRIGMNDIKFG